MKRLTQIGSIKCPHYKLVPKDLFANLHFRRNVLKMGALDSGKAAELRRMCSEDLLFYINVFCLAEGTLVVTDRGPVPIESILLEDKVWDGNSWISHDGLLHKGRKSVISAYGINLTPDHEVLTDYGWQKAVHRYDRAEVRLPDGYSEKWAIPENNQGGMAMPLRVRKRMDCSRGQPKAREGCKLWLQEGGQGNTWPVKRKDLSRVAIHESPMPQSRQPRLSPLRRSRNSNRFAMEKIRGFSGRYGGAAKWGHDDRPDRQQRELYKTELSMGDPKATGKQHEAECCNQNFQRSVFYNGGGQNSGNHIQQHAEAYSVGSKGRPTTASEIQQIANVYDLLNCGPNQAFTVIGSDGAPVLVHNCWTYDPRQESPVLPFITYPFQDEAMLNIADCVQVGEDFAVPKSRAMGASWMGLTVFEWLWHFRSNLSFLLISRNEKYVDDAGNPKSLFWKIDFLHKYQPRWLLPRGRELLDKDPLRKSLHLGNAENGSVIDGESTTGDAGRGDRRTAMFIDEHAAFDLNDGFRVLRATRDTTNCRGFNSTPQGAANAFYDVCHNSAARQIRLHWRFHPLYNRGLYSVESGEVELLDDFRGKVRVQRKGEERGQEVMFPGEYPFIKDGRWTIRSPWFDNQCARCVSEMEIAQELEIDFLGSDYQFFDPETIGILMKKYARPALAQGNVSYDPETLEPKRFNDDNKGQLQLWMTIDGADRIPADRKFVIGIDVSAGTGASNSVASVVDVATAEKVAVYRDPHIRPNPFADRAIALAKFFNNALMIWDASGPTGRTFTMRVMAKGYGNVYYRRYEKKIGRKITDEPGYYLNPEARTHVLENYREALGGHNFINRSRMGLKECLQFVVQPGGIVVHSGAASSQDPSGARTAHGDETIADALANHGLTERESMPRPEKPEVPMGCLAWRRDQKRLQEASMNPNTELVGQGW